MAIEETVERQDSGSGERQIVPFCMCESYLRATERAALAGARWLGRADQESAEEAAFSGMEAVLGGLPVSGRGVIGGGGGPGRGRLRGAGGAGGRGGAVAPRAPRGGRGGAARGRAAGAVG